MQTENYDAKDGGIMGLYSFSPEHNLQEKTWVLPMIAILHILRPKLVFLQLNFLQLNSVFQVTSSDSSNFVLPTLTTTSLAVVSDCEGQKISSSKSLPHKSEWHSLYSFATIGGRVLCSWHICNSTKAGALVKILVI